MNKFGIFSLLNSFLEFYKKNNVNKGEEKETKQDFSSILNNFLGSNKESKSTPPPVNNSAMPLQRDMLNVMASHDEIVKKVLEKEKK